MVYHRPPLLVALWIIPLWQRKELREMGIHLIADGSHSYNLAALLNLISTGLPVKAS